MLLALQSIHGNSFVQRILRTGATDVGPDHYTNSAHARSIGRELPGVARQFSRAYPLVPVGDVTHLRRAYLEDLFLLYAAAKDLAFSGGPGVQRISEDEYLLERPQARSRFWGTSLVTHAEDLEQVIEEKLESKMASVAQRMLERRTSGGTAAPQDVGVAIMAWYGPFIENHLSSANAGAVAWLRAQIDRRLLPAPDAAAVEGRSRLGAEVVSRSTVFLDT